MHIQGKINILINFEWWDHPGGHPEWGDARGIFSHTRSSSQKYFDGRECPVTSQESTVGNRSPLWETGIHRGKQESAVGNIWTRGNPLPRSFPSPSQGLPEAFPWALTGA